MHRSKEIAPESCRCSTRTSIEFHGAACVTSRKWYRCIELMRRFQRSYDECDRCSSPDCQVLEDYRARLCEAEASLSDIMTQSLQLVAGTSSTPSLFPPPPSAPPAVSYIIYNPLAHDRMELVNLCVLSFAVSFAFFRSAFPLDFHCFTTVPNRSFTRPVGCEYVSPTVLDASGAAVQVHSLISPAALILADVSSQAQVGVNETLLAMMFECTVSCPQLYTESKYSDSLHFIAHVPAGGYASYTLSFDFKRNSSTTQYPVISPLSETPSITNGHVTLHFSPDSGLLSRVTTAGGSEFSVRQNYWSYIDPQGGAYCLVEQQAAVQLSQVCVCPPSYFLLSPLSASAAIFHSHVACINYR